MYLDWEVYIIMLGVKFLMLKLVESCETLEC